MPYPIALLALLLFLPAQPVMAGTRVSTGSGSLSYDSAFTYEAAGREFLRGTTPDEKTIRGKWILACVARPSRSICRPFKGLKTTTGKYVQTLSVTGDQVTVDVNEGPTDRDGDVKSVSQCPVDSRPCLCFNYAEYDYACVSARDGSLLCHAVIGSATDPVYRRYIRAAQIRTK